MIKIIKWGNYVICPHCKCEFTFEKEDVWYGSQLDYCEIVTCPCCEHKIDLRER